MTTTVCDTCGIPASDKFVYMSVRRYWHRKPFIANGSIWHENANGIDLCSSCKHHLDKYLKFVGSKWELV